MVNGIDHALFPHEHEYTAKSIQNMIRHQAII